MRRVLFASLALLALAGCNRDKAEPTTPTSALETGPGIVVSGGRLVLPAVPGNPAALYMNLSNQASSVVRLIGVDIAGADKTELHESTGNSMQALKLVPIAPGGTVSFAPGGKHGMVFGLKPTIKPGAMVDISLHLSDGKTLAAQARVETVSGDTGDMADMPGMDHDMNHDAGSAR